MKETENMELNVYFKSIIDQDRSSIVVCNLKHEMIYMNPAAVKSYEKYGGSQLIGQSLFNCHHADSNQRIREVVDWFLASAEHNLVHTFYNEKQKKDVYMVALRDAHGRLIGYYEKHEYRSRETMPLYDLF